jgi:hypothetical protein
MAEMCFYCSYVENYCCLNEDECEYYDNWDEAKEDCRDYDEDL